MTAALGCIYGLAMLFFTIAFIAEWIKYRKEIWPYLKYGLWFGVAVVGLDLFIVTLTPSAWSSSLLPALFAEPIILLRLIGVTMLGMYYATILGYPSFPFILRKSRPALIEETPVSITPNESTISQVSDQDTLQENQIPNSYSVQPGNTAQDQTIRRPPTDLLSEINWKEYLLKVLGVGILGILYSSILFLLTTPQMSEIAKQKFGVSSINHENAITIPAVLVLFEIAIAEEIVFRLGIQNFLVKHLKLQSNNYWIAIVITSALWTLGHTGALEPEWVKLAQIFPVGLMLGWLYKKFGTESTIFVHGMFNLVLALLSGYLIK